MTTTSPAKYGPSFHTSRTEHDLLNQIADRAVAVAKSHRIDYEKMTALMDLTACHANGCELDLIKLLAAPDADFGHDVFGIRRFIDRSTGRLTNCFLPRCAASQS